MHNEQFTKIPNVLFDKLLKDLTHSELKILLIIIRQTNGWVDKKTMNRKNRDRISHSQFIQKTGLSRRIISQAINKLLQKELIEISDKSGTCLIDASFRRGQSLLYYSSLIHEKSNSFGHQESTCAKCDQNMCKSRQKHVQKVIYNKRNYNKRKPSKETNVGFTHIGEVLEEMKSKWKLQ